MQLGPGMIMDVITVLLLLLSTISGARKGFAMTVMSFMQWFVCIVLGMVFCDRAKTLLMEETAIDDFINAQILKHIETTIEESSSYQALPDLFSSMVNDTAEGFAYGTASTVTSVLMTAVAFLTIVFSIKAIGFVFAHLFSRKYNDGITGFFDGFLGFLFGIGRGCLLILLFYVVLVPVLGIIWPELSELVSASIEDSYAAKLLYDNNMLLILVRDFFS